MPGTKPVRKLEDLAWDGVAGVDYGAHRTNGWMVLKSEGTDLDARIDAVLSALEKTEVPEEVAEAASLLNTFVTTGNVEKALDPASETEEEREWYEKRDYSAAQRAEMAKAGKAIPVRGADGSITSGRYPINDGTDLRAAIASFGRGAPGDKGSIKSHIMRAARRLGLSNMIPDSWSGMTKSAPESGEEGSMAEQDESTSEDVKKEEAADSGADEGTEEATPATEEEPEADEGTEEATEEAPAEESSDGGEEAAVEKAETLEQVQKALLERVQKAEERAAEAEKVAKAERDLRLDAEWIAKAEGFTKNLTVDPKEFGPRLRKMEQSDPEMAAEIERVLRSADAIVSEHSIYEAVGKSVTGAGSDAHGKIEALAKDRVSKGLAKDEVEAKMQVLDTPEGKALAEQYDRERQEVK